MGRGRKPKKGLEYFPVDVDMFSDIKIRKLIRRHGGRAVAVYTLMLCFIYKQGYYMQGDDDLPFILSEQLPDFDESYIKTVLQSCFEVGLFNSRIYSEENIISSQGIQERYQNVMITMNRKSTISEYNLLEDDFISSDKIEEKPISSQENQISSQENQISSDNSRISSNFGTSLYKKEKKRKEKKEINKENKFGREILLPLKECEELMKLNETWRENFVMNQHHRGIKKYSTQQIDLDIEEFFRMLQDRSTEKITMRQAYEHFANWMYYKTRENENRSNPTQYSGGQERASQRLAGEGSVSAPVAVQL